jgi:hypothetical protein
LSAGLLDRLGENPSLSASDRTRLRRTFWDEGFQALTRYDSPDNITAGQGDQGEPLVYVTVPPGVGTGGLLHARELLRLTFAAMGRDGGVSAAVEPGGMAGFVMLMSQYQSGQEVAPLLPHSVADWRRAGEELANWSEAVRLLRGLEAGRRFADQLGGVLDKLSEFAGVGPTVRSGHAAATGATIDSLRGSAAALLTLRLQQVGAWPLPQDDPVGAFGRALWSLWRPITGKRALIRCRWRDGCSRLLPDGAHGNRRFCDDHRREAARERAARNRLRARSSAAGDSNPAVAVQPE